MFFRCDGDGTIGLMMMMAAAKNTDNGDSEVIVAVMRMTMSPTCLPELLAKALPCNSTMAPRNLGGYSTLLMSTSP